MPVHAFAGAALQGVEPQVQELSLEEMNLALLSQSQGVDVLAQNFAEHCRAV